MSEMDGGPLVALDDTGAETVRPEPNGIRDGLFVIAVAFMIVVPAAALYVLYRFRGYATETGATGKYLALAGIGVMGISGAWAGYKVYSGSPDGRNSAMGIAMFGVLIVNVVALMAGLQNSFFITLIPIGIVYYLGASAICRNNYHPKYNHIPIRPQLSGSERLGWTAWGVLASVAVAVMCVWSMVSPTE